MVTCANCSAPNRDENEKCYSCNKPLTGSQPLSGSKPLKGDKAVAVKGGVTRAVATKSAPTASKSNTDLPTVTLPIAIGLMAASAFLSILICYFFFIAPLHEDVAAAELMAAKAKLAAANMSDRAGSGVASTGASPAGHVRGSGSATRVPGAAATDDRSY